MAGNPILCSGRKLLSQSLRSRVDLYQLRNVSMTFTPVFCPLPLVRFLMFLRCLTSDQTESVFWARGVRIRSLGCGQTPWRDHATSRRAGDCLCCHSTATFPGNWRYNGEHDGFGYHRLSHALVLVLCRCDDASLTCRNRLHAGTAG